MPERIEKIEALPLRIPRKTPYLGPLEQGVTASSKGYFIRPGNSSIYSVHDQTLLLKVVTSNGRIGWGECVSFVAPQIVKAILDEVIIPLVIGRDPHKAVEIYEDLYNAMRVRGYFGGYYHDALACLDIALWDLKGKMTGLPVSTLLGAQRRTKIPAYVSGLPKPTRDERAEMAKEWTDKGFSAIKFAAAVANDGVIAEMQSIRQAIGPDPDLLVDMHWKHTALEAVKLIRELEKYDLYVAEAPVHPEDADGQSQVVNQVRTPIGIGEELRTAYEYLPRFTRRCMSIIQPEMGRMGITSFWQVCQMAKAFHVQIMPHASIGIGIFQAASLQISACLSEQILPYHEYQHSIFDANLKFIKGNMLCTEGYFHVPDGPGLGVEPTDEVLHYVIS